MDDILNRIQEIKKLNNKDRLIKPEERLKRNYKDIPKLDLVTLNKINNNKKRYKYLTYKEIYELNQLLDQKRKMNLSQ